MIRFPWGQNDDGSPRRLTDLVVQGKNNPTTALTGDSHEISGQIVTIGQKSTVYFVTQSQAEEASNNAAQSEVLPDLRAIPIPEAKASVDNLLNKRFGELTDRLMDRINEKDPTLYRRFTDPRFLAPLATAHRAYAETGSDELGDTLAGLLTELAAQPVRSRKELVLRQALDAAPRLTTQHLNSLAVYAHFTAMSLTNAYGAEDLVRKFDNLLRPYYGTTLSKSIDYNYMSAVGVCDNDILGSFSAGPFKVLYDQYPNFMYPPFTLEEIQEVLTAASGIQAEDGQALLEKLLMSVPATPEDLVAHEGQFLIRKDGARFRIAQDQVGEVLSKMHVVKKDLTPPQRKLRDMVERRSISQEDFESLGRETAPEMAQFFDQLQQAGGLNIRLNAVGLMLAQHVIRAVNPAAADAIDASFNDDEDD
jgi:hypothetical protein